MFIFILPHDLKKVQIEDGLYFSLRETMKDDEIIDYLRKNPCNGYKEIYYNPIYKPLPYQVL